MNASADNSRLPLLRLLLVGALVPAVFALVDHSLLNQLQDGSPASGLVALTMAAFVGQIALLGWLCGRLLSNPWWRWGLYLWGWVLVDLQLATVTIFVRGSWSVAGVLPGSLFAAQLGLVIVWAVLGDTRWAIRLPACAVLGTLLALPMNLGYGFSSEIFPVQLVSLAALCLLLWWRGFRLQRTENGETPARGTPSSKTAGHLQFNIRHVLIWTTSLAIVLGVLRALDLLSLGAWMPYFGRGWLAVLTGGLLLACVFVVSLWAALGAGPLWFRLPILLLALLTCGFSLGVIHFCTNASPLITFAQLWSYRREFWVNDGWYVVWVSLAGGLLAASLVILRVIGYRLVQSRKKLTPASQAAA